MAQSYITRSVGDQEFTQGMVSSWLQLTVLW